MEQLLRLNFDVEVESSLTMHKHFMQPYPRFPADYSGRLIVLTVLNVYDWWVPVGTAGHWLAVELTSAEEGVDLRGTGVRAASHCRLHAQPSPGLLGHPPGAQGGCDAAGLLPLRAHGGAAAVGLPSGTLSVAPSRRGLLLAAGRGGQLLEAAGTLC